MIALEYLADHRDLVDQFADRPVRIWSDQWRLFWRPDAAGYTPEISDAEIYTLADAYVRSHHCGREKRIRFDPLEPLPGQDSMASPAPDPPLMPGCWECARSAEANGNGCAGRHWRVDGNGFEPRIWSAPSRSAARYRDFRAAKEAGYAGGNGTFREYMARCASVRQARAS